MLHRFALVLLPLKEIGPSSASATCVAKLLGAPYYCHHCHLVIAVRRKNNGSCGRKISCMRPYPVIVQMFLSLLDALFEIVATRYIRQVGNARGTYIYILLSLPVLHIQGYYLQQECM